MTSTIKQGIRADKIAQRQRKTRHTGLTDIEHKIIKACEKLDQADKPLYGRKGFYETVKRTHNNAVDWASLTPVQLEYFEHIQAVYDKACKRLSMLQEKHDIDDYKMHFIYEKFNKLNCHSVSF